MGALQRLGPRAVALETIPVSWAILPELRREVMSIISDAAHGKISWLTAAGEIGTWFKQIFDASPPAVQAIVTMAESDLKQVASDVIGLADTALGPIIGIGAAAVEGAFNTAAIQALGPNATEINVAFDVTIKHIADGLKAAVDAEAAALRAKLAPKVGG